MKVGDEREIQITGVVGKFRGKVVEITEAGHPYFKVLDNPSWDPFTLKPGDYIIMSDQD